MKKTTILLFLSFFLSFHTLWSKSDSPSLSLWFDTPCSLNGRAVWLRAPGNGVNPDQEWESRSLPIGNGSLGANIMGSIAAERITLNEKSLWKGGPNTAGGADYYWNVNKESAHLLKEIRQAFLDGDQKRAQRLTAQNFNGLAHYEEKDESPFRFGTYTTMGELYIETGLSEVGMTGYRRTLSLDSAIATVGFQKDGTVYRRSYYVSYPDSVMVMKFAADQKGMQNLVLSYLPNSEAESSWKREGEDEWIYRGRLHNNKMKFVIRIKVIRQGGELEIREDRIIVKGADEVVFLLTADTDYRMNFAPDFKDPLTYVGGDPDLTTRQMMDQASQKGTDQLWKRHLADYSSLFHRVRLRLAAGGDSLDLPIDRRLIRYRQGNPDPYLEQLYYQYGRYLLIASSRGGNLPANLQGMWHNNLDGPWRVDYHNNINLQMNYWPACPTNLSECTYPLTDFIRTLVRPGEKTACSYFGARGWTASISGNAFGFTAPLSSQAMTWNFNPMAGPWLATHLWDYYDYTRDLRYLKEVAYDPIRSSARFTVDYLWKRPDGSYTAAPSTSPEHGPVDEGVTFVHAVVREILSDAIQAAEVLNVDAKERKEWQEVLDRLVPYKIGRYGQLLEWSKDIDDPEDKHRHVNHLFGLHPGKTISPIITPHWAAASEVVLEHRGDGATGWSMGWKLNQWARLHNGNRAYLLYSNLLKNGTLDNLWDTHPPFQIDGNFGGTAGVTEMLMQSHMGFIHLLPALPDVWKEGSIEGLCARGHFEVSVSWKDHRLEEAVIVSKSGGMCHLRYDNLTLSFSTKKGKVYRIGIQDDKMAKKILF